MGLLIAHRHAADAVSATTIASCLMGWLPPIAALLGIIWYILQIYSWFEKRMLRKRNRSRSEGGP
jgi:hypothetical protein